MKLIQVIIQVNTIIQFNTIIEINTGNNAVQYYYRNYYR